MGEWDFLRVLDWHIFRDAALAMWHGDNPYLSGEGALRFYNPWWMLVILMPLFLLPASIGAIINTAISFLIYIPVTRKFNISPVGFGLIVTSSFHMHHVVTCNADWLVWIGLFLPPPIALLFYAIKPQMGIGLIVWTLWRCYQNDGIGGVGRALAPLIALGGIGLVLFGMPANPMMATRLALFPFGVPMGIGLAYLAWRARGQVYSIQAAPLISPYVSYHSCIGLLFVRDNRVLLIIWLISYIPFVLERVLGWKALT